MSEVVHVQYDVDPAMVCGGILVDGQGFVEVAPQEEFRDDKAGISLWEYAEPNGDVRACLLRVDEGRSSPRWHILSNAGGGEYYELHQTVSGLGSLVLEQPSAVVGAEHRIIELPVRDGTPAQVTPDDVFSVQAHNSIPDSAGTYVLATFPGVPFKLSYEERL